MNLFWIYDLPNWLFGTLVVAVYVVYGVAGLFASRKFAKRLHQVDHSHNDIVSYYLAAVTVFYGITLGLVAVGTWNTFSAITNKIDDEAGAIASISRDVRGYGEPLKSVLKQDLKGYVKNIIYVSWPEQSKGIVPTSSGEFLDSFQNHLMSFKPANTSDAILHSEVFKQFNVLVEYRRARLNAVHTRIPASLWSLVIIGAFISLTVTFFFDMRSFSMHFCMTMLLSALIGLIIFLVGTLDNPFRGRVNISSEPFKLVYHQLLKNNGR